jgi:alcohol dehydrogenase class IV
MPEPAWDLDRLRQTDVGKAALWVTPSVRERARAAFVYPIFAPDFTLPEDLQTLIVIGGGTLIDRAKAIARNRERPLRLIAIPSIWGSGAEVSPIVVLDDGGKKTIRIDARYIPDECVIWPELLETIEPIRAREACGDSWSHALEGFLSPLASDDVRLELALVIREMLALPIGLDARWFSASARACAGQARSSVGLVHGIAHVLESVLRLRHADARWGHARLCSTFLWPVMEFNRQGSDKWSALLQRYEIDEQAVLAVVRELHDQEAYRQAVDVLPEFWSAVLRDPCTRTNSVLVRPASLDFFRSWGSHEPSA